MTERLPAHELRIATILLVLGLVVMTSASMEVAQRDFGNALYYLQRQGMLAFVGLIGALVLAQIPLRWHQKLAPLYALGAIALLVVVLLPGMGNNVNNSTRWLQLGPVQFQPSELMKPLFILWLACWLSRCGEDMRSNPRTLIVPLIVLMTVCALLLLEPDFGTACVIAATAIGMIFLCGGHLGAILSVGAFGMVGLAGLVIAAPYRMLRLKTFLDPWADPFDTGYQITQSLIAIGSGGFWGLGLGSGVQKHFYLPEVHTDFVFAVAVEELGLLGAMLIIGLFVLLILMAFRIARSAQDSDNVMGAALAYGIGVWIGLQALVNVAVNLGAVPTKGLTLPLMSAGGSSLIATMLGLALLWRVRHELNAQVSGKKAPSQPSKWSRRRA